LLRRFFLWVGVLCLLTLSSVLLLARRDPATTIAFRIMHDYSDSLYTWEIYRLRTDNYELKPLTLSLREDRNPSWSPDGQWIAYNSGDFGEFDIYRMTPQGKNQVNLTRSAGYDGPPLWSPDGQWIVFDSRRDGQADIYRMRPDGSGLLNVSQTPTSDEILPGWSEDGQWILYYSDRDGAQAIYRTNVAEGFTEKLSDEPRGYRNFQGIAPPIDLPWRSGVDMALVLLLLFGALARIPARM
jgi:Tol biopolymer transport system component